MKIYKITAKDPRDKSHVVYLRNKDSVEAFARRLPDQLTIVSIDYVKVPSVKHEFLHWLNQEIRRVSR